ncbi:hypothetical protein ACRQ4C_01495 [Curtobacterium sp. SP.BCp]|uniref:hypothetical protein n=1 Tax=Curtobacterium sp. SP.BCp TaxID=3435230 RepID=UPI003F73BB00
MKYLYDGTTYVETNDILAAAVERASATAGLAWLIETLQVPTSDEYGQAAFAPFQVGDGVPLEISAAPDDELEHSYGLELPATNVIH